MLATLVMTVIGPDRPGLVELIASHVTEQGGNWLESRMCRLGGQFAGLVRVEIDAGKTDALVAALRGLESKGLRIVSQTEKSDRSAAVGTLAVLELIGQDRPGIVRQIAHILASHSVNVEELTSEVKSAPMDGTMLFQAKATVLLPPNVSLPGLRADLERIASDLMVDVEFNPSPR